MEKESNTMSSMEFILELVKLGVAVDDAVKATIKLDKSTIEVKKSLTEQDNNIITDSKDVNTIRYCDKSRTYNDFIEKINTVEFKNKMGVSSGDDVAYLSRGKSPHPCIHDGNYGRTQYLFKNKDNHYTYIFNFCEYEKECFSKIKTELRKHLLDSSVGNLIKSISLNDKSFTIKTKSCSIKDIMDVMYTSGNIMQTVFRPAYEAYKNGDQLFLNL